MSSDLLFQQSATSGSSAELVFGADEVPVVENRSATAVGTLPRLSGRVGVRTSRGAAVDGVLPGISGRVVSAIRVTARVGVAGRLPTLQGASSVRYLSNTERPIVCDVTAQFQRADKAVSGIRERFEQSKPFSEGQGLRFSDAAPVVDLVGVRWQEASRFAQRRTSVFQNAAPLAKPAVRAHFQEAARTRRATGERFQEATRVPFPVARSHYQEAFRDRRNFTAARFQTGHAYSVALRENEAVAAALAELRRGRYQPARRPPIGIWIPGANPVSPPCYEPKVPADLLFAAPWSSSTDLLFVCERVVPPEPGQTVVVPIREVYLTINSATLIRLDTGDEIPVTSASISIDYESWTWTLSAAAPGRALSQLQRNSNGDPVAVQLTVNGTPLHFLVESISRDRSFASSALRIQGRGFAAELDAPYAPTMSFANPFARTGRQLLDDILTLNGVPIGWSVDKALFTDWNVPAKVFSHTGTYISALNAVAGAIGAYIQPHDTERKLDVLLRYPTPAWAWGDVVPDFELPAAVTSQESIEWVTNPDYDRAFVVGQENGITGQYSRAGSAGTLVAETVTDPLITEAAAARQRGRSVLSEGGQIANVTLRLPVLAETGIIRPGKFVRYVDGSTVRKGLVRGVSADVAMPTIYQTVRVETRV